MPEDDIVYDEWLPRWEHHLKTGGPTDIDAFIREHCENATPEVVAVFRRKAGALRSLSPHLRPIDAATPGPGEGDTGRTAPDDLVTGNEPITGYRLERRLGRGGFGEVWRATGPDGAGVAIKFVLAGGGAERAEVRGLEHLIGIHHPHLITYQGAWENDRHLMIVMELADRTVAERLAQARSAGLDGIPREELMRYMVQAAAALDFLNAGGPYRAPSQHRDVKPQNLLLVGDTLKLGDFGLLRPMEHSVTQHTGNHTPAFAAPEFSAGRLTSQTDQYSLAVTYCQLRGGRLPFVGSNLQMMHAHSYSEPDLSMLPDEERPIVRRALAKTPRHRWSSCTAFVAALRDGADPASVRNELIADPDNVTLRRLYLAVRTPTQLRADQNTPIGRDPNLLLFLIARWVSLPLLVLATCFAKHEDLDVFRLGGFQLLWIFFPATLLILLVLEIRDRKKHRTRVRALTTALGPLPYFRFGFENGKASFSMNESALLTKHLGKDRDVSGVKPPAVPRSAPPP